MAGMCRAIPTAPIMAIIVVAVVMAAAVTGIVAKDSSGEVSSITSWSGKGCTGDMSYTGLCGCSDLLYYGGQEFYYRGETATFYTGTSCTGTPYQMFKDFEACDDFGWRSVRLDC